MKKSLGLLILLTFILSACGTKDSSIKESREPVKIQYKIQEETIVEKTKEPEKLEEIEETEETEEAKVLPDINDFWDKDNNYLNLKDYLYACGATNIVEDYMKSNSIIEYIVDIYGYKVFIYTINEGNVPNLLFGKSEDEIIAYYDFDRSEHQIMMTIVDKDTSPTVLVHTETLEVLPELLKALSLNEVNNLENYIYL